MRSEMPTDINAQADQVGSSAERDHPVQVLGRAAEILRLLSHAPGGLSQAEIAKRLGFARTTAHRITSALSSDRLIEIHGTSGRYRLGSEILRLADAERAARVSDVHPQLQALSRSIDETVDLAVLDRAQVLFIDQVVAQHRLRAVSGVGGVFPAHCTAPGKAMLAMLPSAEVDRMMPAVLTSHTDNTITSMKALHDELERVREQGFALDLEEHTLGISAVGISLHGTVFGMASISVPIPAQRFAEKRDPALQALRSVGAKIEADWRAGIARG